MGQSLEKTLNRMNETTTESGCGAERQIKSRERVSRHGEVFTNPREVNAMLDLVGHETERPDSRFLEPACGNGNFLVAILERKLAVVTARHHLRSEYELNTIIAVSSLYGIELLEDNVEECRERLYDIVRRHHGARYEAGDECDFLRSVRYVIRRNIVCGDALTMMSPDGRRPVSFAEWSCIGDGKIKRRDFTLDMLLKNQPMEEPNLFSDLGDEAFIPTPFREFPPTHYLIIYTQDDTEEL